MCSRSRCLALVAAFGAVAAGLACSGEPAGGFSTDPELPNLILITADDLGWKDLGSYGNEQISTPHIDRLALEGVRFSHAFVAASSCSPSRASLITGQYPHTHGVTGLTHIHPRKSLSPFHQTLPDLLREARFNTALQGKWHVSPFLPTSWYGYNERLSGFLVEDFWLSDVTNAIDFITRNRNNRFYLELNFMQTHRDAEGEFHFDANFPVDPDAVRVPEYWTLPHWPEIREDVARYFSQAMKMDQLVGQVLQTLDDLQLAENTMVVFVSDNGPPYPGNKMTLYDRGTGTPLLVRWPGKLPAGRVVDHLVSSIDIMPTMLEAAGVTKPHDVQGRSLLGIMQGHAAPPGDEVVFSEMTHHVHYLPTRALRTRRWKYIKNYSDIAVGLDQNQHDDWAHRLCELPNQPWKGPRLEEELYDLVRDPDEQVNLAAEPAHARQLQEMRALLRRHMDETQDPFLDAPFTHDHDPKAYEREE